MPVALEHLAHAPSSAPLTDAAGLRPFLDAVPDPRDRRGRLYPLPALLAAAAAAVPAGARSLAAIGEWITDAPRWAAGTLGFAPDPLTGQVVVPHPATVRRLFARLDGDALDAAIGAFLSARTARTREPDTLRPIAVDGKTVRGSRTRTTAAVSLLAAMAHSGEVLAQRQVANKSNEIPSFAPLLNGADLSHAVITADALHTQHGHGTYLRSRGAHYITVVKKNHPGLFDRVRTLPWREITLDHYERTRAHHRDEIRRLKTAAFAHLDYPDARQALQAVRWRRDLGSGKLTIERIYLITSLPPGAATGAQLLPGSEATGASRTFSTTSVTGPSARTTPRSVPLNCPAQWPVSGTWLPASTGRTARRTSQPPSGTRPATTVGPWPSSASPDESGQDHFTQRPCLGTGVG